MAGRKHPIAHNKALYLQRHQVEMMFGRLKDRRRIHTRCDRSVYTFVSAITLAANIIFWIKPE